MNRLGYAVCYVNQTKIALLLGMSRSTVGRSIARLRSFGWIEEIRLRENGRAYKVGTVRNGMMSRDVVYWADKWLSRTLKRMPKQLKDWQHKSIRKRTRRLERLLATRSARSEQSR
jgi:hypothetical protein